MKQWRGLGLAMELSWTLLFALLVPLLLGIWLDKHFGTTPILTLIGVLLGILAGTLGMARMVVRLYHPEQKKPDREAGNNSKEEPE